MGLATEEGEKEPKPKKKAKKGKDTIPAAPADKSKTPPGPFLGPDGKQKHCAKFDLGTCEYGDKCRFAHTKAGKAKAKAKVKAGGTPPASPRLSPEEKAKTACPFHSTPKGCLKGAM